MSAVEEKLGIFFASCPMIRQFLTHTLRARSLLPSSQNTPSDRDFIAMRKRIKLRDIFWYRQRTPDDVTPAAGEKPNKPKHISPRDDDVKYSALDRLEAGIRRAFRRDKRRGHAKWNGAQGGDDEAALAGKEAPETEWGSEGSGKASDGETFLLSATNASRKDWPLTASATASSA